jgi:hypothetical protein
MFACFVSYNTIKIQPNITILLYEWLLNELVLLHPILSIAYPVRSSILLICDLWLYPRIRYVFYAISSHAWTFSIVHVRMNVMRTTLHLLLVVNVLFRPPRESLHPQSTDHVTSCNNQVVRRTCRMTLENVVSKWDVTCVAFLWQNRPN